MLTAKPWCFTDINNINSYIDGPNSFSVNELVHFTVLITKVAGMCSTCKALKINREHRLSNFNENDGLHVNSNLPGIHLYEQENRL